METILIFANGDIADHDWIRPFLARATAVIAVNGGTRHLQKLSHLPDLVIGDMDSLRTAAKKWLKTAAVPQQTHPAAKDETDLELALRYAARHYPAAQLIVFGAVGGRFDQTIANLLLLAHPHLQGRQVTLQTRYERIWLIQQQTEIAGAIGDKVSLIPLDGDALIESTTGLKWPLQQETLQFGPARGISNVMTARTAMVSVAAGTVICVHVQKEWTR